jgi:phospholipase C
MANLVEHVFVLMLENRAFDHMLGFSGITGRDAVNGDLTQIVGLTGSEVNSFNGGVYQVSRGADNVMPADPGHEFNNVLEQLSGPRATYPAGDTYPAINNTGLVASYMASGGAADPGEVMKRMYIASPCHSRSSLTLPSCCPATAEEEKWHRRGSPVRSRPGRPILSTTWT